MKTIPDAHKKVPMMFRAQVRGRSQLQYPDRERRKAGEPQDIELWASEWTDKAELVAENRAQEVQTATYGAKIYDISWRFVTNGGQDDGMLRPVIGASGIPFYPGSSMKGAFRHACETLESAGEVPQKTCQTYCGNEEDLTPGLLRFHGAYPINDWTDRLLDLVHPQQGWQVTTHNTTEKPEGESAYAQISLYKPTLRFAISSPMPLSEKQWQQIWRIWEQALAMGLGSKVSNGYGKTAHTAQSILFKARIAGRGQVAKLLDDTGEFRHNIFRAALRGHALRIFGGLVDVPTAESLVDELFGGIHGQESTVGFLGMQFREIELEIKSFEFSYGQPAYAVKGDLVWFLTRPLPNADQESALKKLIAKLMQFAMVLGGFGKSWRRVDHLKFFKEYYEDSYKALIGCHWEWASDSTKRRHVQLGKPEQLKAFIDKVQDAARAWITLRGGFLQNSGWANEWREAWHPSQVQVWGRMADNDSESVAVWWFHQPYQSEIQGVQAAGSIYKSSLTGKVGKISQISRLWHRMYPVVILKKDPNNPKQPIVKSTPRYLEFITIFPDDSSDCHDFLEFLATNPDGFQLLWGEQ